MGTLRTVVLVFAKPVIVLEAVAERIASEYFQHQPFLFRDSAEHLKCQLEKVDALICLFNELAGPLGAEPLTLDQAREVFRLIADANIEPRINLARLEMLRTFGTVDEQLSAVRSILGDPNTSDFLSTAIPDSTGRVSRNS